MIKFVGPRLYSEFVNGTEKMKYCDDTIVLVPYMDEKKVCRRSIL